MLVFELLTLVAHRNHPLTISSYDGLPYIDNLITIVA